MSHATSGSVCLLAALLAALPAQAQTAASQKVTGPQARYWLSAETGSGLGAAMQGGGGGFGAIMGAVLGRGGPTKTLRLELGGSRDANPAQAQHAVPAALGMGAALTLLGPERAQPAPERPERDVPEFKGERPQGRLLFFWGCGESAGAGQPVVLDIAKMADGVLPPNLRSITVAGARSGPSPGRDRAYADWPNRQHSADVPAQASLVGEHTVQGNFVPEIRFAVSPAHDYMEAVTLNRSPLPSGAQLLRWNRVATALGYFASGMGFKAGADGVNDMVVWNSSSARMLGGEQLQGFLPPAETERLVKANAVLAPTITECAVPREVQAAAGGELLLINLNAFGPELNVVHPPRPADPKVTWDQQYQVKLRLRSYTGSFAGMGAALGGAAGAAAGESPPAADGGEKAADKPNPAEAVKGILKGIFGR